MMLDVGSNSLLCVTHLVGSARYCNARLDLFVAKMNFIVSRGQSCFMYFAAFSVTQPSDLHTIPRLCTGALPDMMKSLTQIQISRAFSFVLPY